MAAKNDTKPVFATRDFNDAGTQRRFTRGEEIKDLTAGEIGNYAAAGLVTADRPGGTDASGPATPSA